MIKDFCFAWEGNKKCLEDYFRTHTMGDYASYMELVKLLFDLVINPSMNERFATEIDEIREIDDGDYQGNLIYILHKDTYHLWVTDYVYTSVCYGSCSCCDTLQGIHVYEYNKLPDEDQIKDYMSLCLNLLENCHYLVG